MSISDHYNEKVTVQRLQDVAESSGWQDYADHLTFVPAMFQPLEDNISQDNAGQFGKTELMICGVCDIKEGDQIIRGATTYRVVAIESFDGFLKGARHMEVQVRAF